MSVVILYGTETGNGELVADAIADTLAADHDPSIYDMSEFAVEDLDLTVNDGEFLCVLGPSGCGKSSTLRMLAGLEAITAGDLLLDGQRINDVPPRSSVCRAR